MRKPTAQQGGPDGLCGLYALLNFLRNHPRFRGDKDQDILRYLLESARHLNLLNPVNISHGFEAHQIRSIMADICTEFDLKYKFEVLWPDTRSLNVQEFYQKLADLTKCGGAAVVSVDAGEHWVLAHRVARNVLICDDSAKSDGPAKIAIHKNGKPERRLDHNHAVLIRPLQPCGDLEKTGEL